MGIRNFVARLRSTRKSRMRRRRGKSMPQVQTLENRALLAGNVSALISGGSLVLRGDAANNAVDVLVVDGNTVVRGRDDTTINGLTTDFVAATGSTSLQDGFFARLGNGNDDLFIEGVTIAGRADIQTAAGNDRVGMRDASVGRTLSISTGRGDDGVDLTSVQVNRNLFIRTHRQADTVSLTNTVISGTARINTGIHDDTVSVATSTVTRNLVINTAAGHDNVVMNEATVNGLLRASTHGGSDLVVMDPATVGRRTVIRTGSASDHVLVQGTSTLSSLRVNTGRGFDTAEVATTVTVNGPSRVRRAESNTVPDASRDDRLNDPTTGALTQVQNLADFFIGLSQTAEPLTLTFDTSANSTQQSSDTLITTDSDFQVDVVTQPGATVAVDSDGDGQFDDGTATADGSGNATLNVTLVNDDSNGGANTLSIQTDNNSGTPVVEEIDVHLAVGTVVRFDTSLGQFDVELFDDDAPNTVGAFLDDLSRYDDSVFHRNVDGFIAQAGGFSADGSGVVTTLDSFSAPPNEIDVNNPANLNARGTISTAQSSNINSFTGQFFFNVIDNGPGSVFNNLDAVPHVPFGRVIGTGMTVVDDINNTGVENLTGLLSGTGAGAFTDTPLVNYTTGTVPGGNNYVRINSVTTISEPVGSENSFRVFENTAAGTVVGTVQSTATDPVIFDVIDSSLPAELALNADDHLEGSATAPVVLVEYISLQCPACAAAQPEVEALLANNPNDVLVVRRHFPLDTNNGGNFLFSFQAALAAEAAGRQGQFDEMVDELFDRQSEWSAAATTAAAEAIFEDIAVNTLGLDLSQYQSDVQDPVLTERIERDIADAEALSVGSTPTFFLNGTRSSSTPSDADVQTAAAAVDRTFALDRLSGELTIEDASDIDFETNPVFNLDVTAANGTDIVIPVTITLIDQFNG